MADNDDQKFLRNVVAAEIKAVLNKHGVGGLVMLSSMTASSWLSVWPTWSGFQPDEVYGVRIRLSSTDPAKSEGTLFMLKSLRDMTLKYHRFIGAFYDQLIVYLQKQGVEVIENEFDGVGEHPGDQPLAGIQFIERSSIEDPIDSALEKAKGKS